MDKIIIVGAGIAGMAAGIYGKYDGYDVNIFEMNRTCGGECTGWDRKGYHFDGCIHWLVGSKKNSSMYKLWEDIGALDESIEITNHDIFSTTNIDGKAINIYCDSDKLKDHLLKIAPEDKKPINEMIKGIKKFSRMEMDAAKPYDLYSKKDMLKMVLKIFPAMREWAKYEKITVGDLLNNFKNKSLKIALAGLVPKEYKATSLISTLSSVDNKDGGWPKGGSRNFAERIEKRFLSLDGKISYNSRVEEILIKNNRAIGIRLSDGSAHYADYVISAADGYHTLFEILKGRYIENEYKVLYTDSVNYPVFSSVQVNLGVESDLSGYPHSNYFKAKRPIDAGGILHEYVGLRHFCHESSFAPEGCSVLSSFMFSDYSWWERRGQDKKEYLHQKDRIANDIINFAKSSYPEIKNKIKVVDVVTPLTYKRYCNAWKGSWMSNATTPGSKIGFLSGRIEGLDNFFMTGQWIMPPGGLPVAAATGKWTIQRINMLKSYLG